MRTALLAYGFRPFFLASGIAALLLLPWWVAIWLGAAAPVSAWPASLWHGHEMLFGFAAAAIAGFLLTAVPNWTGARGFAGMQLLRLVLLWLAGRAAIMLAGNLPAWLVGTLDALFLPALAAQIAVPIIRQRNRNLPLLGVLGALALCNIVFHVAAAKGRHDLASGALLATIDIVLLLVTIIGGRIVPAFTANALRAAGNAVPMAVWRGVTPLAIASMIAVLASDLLAPGSRLAGVVAFVAGIAQALRLAQWQGWRTARLPIVWVLHVGYLWLVIGLLLKGLALAAGIAAASFWMHALTVGSAATMILGVMTRAALGHTGRPLIAHPVTVFSYGAVTAAALLRVFGPATGSAPYQSVVIAAAACWILCWGAYLLVYGPILTGPRADGRDG